MYAILIEGYRIGDFNRHPPDPHLNVARSQHARDFLIEVGHRHCSQRQYAAGAVTLLQYKLVVDEVKPHFERSISVRDGRGGEPTSVYVKRDIPPVIDQGSEREPDLTDDLRP